MVRVTKRILAPRRDRQEVVRLVGEQEDAYRRGDSDGMRHIGSVIAKLMAKAEASGRVIE